MTGQAAEKAQAGSSHASGMGCSHDGCSSYSSCSALPESFSGHATARGGPGRGLLLPWRTGTGAGTCRLQRDAAEIGGKSLQQHEQGSAPGQHICSEGYWMFRALEMATSAGVGPRSHTSQECVHRAESPRPKQSDCMQIAQTSMPQSICKLVGRPDNAGDQGRHQEQRMSHSNLTSSKPVGCAC